jgi:hypothetical protein
MLTDRALALLQSIEKQSYFERLAFSHTHRHKFETNYILYGGQACCAPSLNPARVRNRPLYCRTISC